MLTTKFGKGRSEQAEVGQGYEYVPAEGILAALTPKPMPFDFLDSTYKVNINDEVGTYVLVYVGWCAGRAYSVYGTVHGWSTAPSPRKPLVAATDTAPHLLRCDERVESANAVAFCGLQFCPSVGRCERPGKSHPDILLRQGQFGAAVPGHGGVAWVSLAADRIREVVRAEVADTWRDKGKLFGQPGIFNDLLSWQSPSSRWQSASAGMMT